MPNKLNDLTTVAIADVYKKLVKKEQACLWCGEVGLMKKNQQFCATRCRTNYHNAVARLNYEKLVTEQQAWRVERDELIREISDLRRQLGQS